MTPKPKKIENNPHEQTLVMNQTEEYKLNQKLNELIWEGQRIVYLLEREKE